MNIDCEVPLRRIIPPEVCPSCGTQLELVGDQLFCKSTSCSAKSIKKLEHYAKTLKIKGLGEKTLEKLAEIDIVDIPDIYSLTLDDLIPITGEKVAIKLLDEIEKSKTVNFATFIAAFSIPLIGDTAGQKMASLNKSLEDITFEDLRSVGIGEKAATNFINWMDEYGHDALQHLPITIINSSNGPTDSSKGTVVVTGTFEKTRSVLEKELRTLGFEPKDSISSKTNYLLLGESKGISSKQKKAQQLNIPIVYSIEELLTKANLE